MHSRCRFLTCPALLCSLVLFIMTAGEARAHRLDAEAFLLPDNKVQVECWFSDGTVPWGARVKVLRGDGQFVLQGQLDKQGIFVFALEKAEPLRVQISAMDGHFKELSITGVPLLRKKKAEPGSSASPPAQDTPVIEGPKPLTVRDTGLPIKELLIGVAFVLALAASVLSLRNARQLRTLRKLLKPDQ